MFMIFADFVDFPKFFFTKFFLFFHPQKKSRRNFCRACFSHGFSSKKNKSAFKFQLRISNKYADSFSTSSVIQWQNTAITVKILQSVTKYLAKSKKIKQNWAKSENFDIANN